MSIVTKSNPRNQVKRQRTVPVESQPRRIPFTGRGEIQGAPEAGPVELVLEVTSAEGELACWFDDFWWVDALTLYKNRPVTIHMAPTPGAALHPVVLHQMEMLRRVEPRWVTIAYFRAEALEDSEVVRHLRQVPYHEVRIIVRPMRKSGLNVDEQESRRITAMISDHADEPPKDASGRTLRVQCISEKDAVARGILPGAS